MAPTLGAVSLLYFETVSGRAMVIKALRENGLPLPFAAQVMDHKGREVGVIGQASKAFVRGISDSGRLTVVWGEGAAGRCYIDFLLPLPEAGSRQINLDVLEGRCINSANAKKVSAP